MKDPSGMVALAYLSACMVPFKGRTWWFLKGLGFCIATAVVTGLVAEVLGIGKAAGPFLLLLTLVAGVGLWGVFWNRKRALTRADEEATAISARLLDQAAFEQAATARREARQAADASKVSAPGVEP